MKLEVFRVFFVVAICPGVLLLLASDHTHGLGISVESEESSLNCFHSCDSCCSSHRSKVHQLKQAITNGEKSISQKCKNM